MGLFIKGFCVFLVIVRKMEAGKTFHSQGQIPPEAADRLADPASQIHAINSLAL